MIGDGASDFAGVLENHVGSIDANSADLLRDFEKFVQLYSAKIKNEQGFFEKNVMNSLSGVSNQIKTQAANEEKYRARQEKAAKDQEIKATKSEKTRDTFLDKAGQAAAKANAQRAEQTKLQKAEAIASELFRSKLVQYVGKIIDQQYEMIKGLAKQKALSPEQARAEQREITNIIANMNKASGGFMYSTKAGMEMVSNLAKQGIDENFQKIALPAALRQKELFGSVSNDFVKTIETIQQRYANTTAAQFDEIFRRQQGLMDVFASASEGKWKAPAVASLLDSTLHNKEYLEALQASGKSLPEAMKILEGVAAVQLAAKDVGVQDAAQSITKYLFDALGDVTPERRSKLAPFKLLMKGTRYESIEALERASGTEIGEIVSIALRQMASNPNFYQMAGYGKQFSSDAALRGLTGRFAGAPKDLAEFNKSVERYIKAVAAPAEEREKALKGLEKNLGDLQTPLEKIAIWCEEWLAQKGVAGWLLGKGSFSTIAGVVTGVLGVIGGKRATEWIKTLFKGGGEGAGAGGGLSGFFAKGGRTAEEAQAIARSGARAGRIVKIGGTALAAGMAGYNLLQYGEAKTEAEKTRLATQTVGLAGGLGGASLGATAGGMLGSFFGPIGTAIGTAAGSITGALFGDEFMQAVAGPFVEEMKPVFDEISGWLKSLKGFWNKNIKPTVSSVWDDIKNGLKNMKDSLVFIVGELFGGIGFLVKWLGTAAGGIMSLVAGEGTLSERWENLREGLGSVFDEYKGKVVKRFDTAKQKQLEEFMNPTPALNGLGYVPRDNFPAYLHEGEMVLTRDEANAYRSLWSKSKKYEDGNDDVGGSSNIYSASDRMNMYNSWAFDVFSDMVSTMKGGKLNWGKVKKEDLAPGFLDVFQSAFNSQGTKQWMHQQGIDGIVIISGKRDLNKQAVLAGKGYGSKTSAHLVGKALDFNFLRGNETIKAFVGNRDADIVDPMSLSLYEGFGQAMSDASGGRLRSGAFFKHKDPNHVEMSITPGERSAIEAQAKRVQDELLMRRAIAAQSEAELSKLKNDPSYYSNMKKTFRDAIVEAYEAGDIQRRMLELSRGEISGPGSVENYGV